MTDLGSGGGDRPEIGELLSGLDPPRSLPESLRQRLEHELSAGAPARPLEPELDERLAAALESREDQDMAMLFSGLDGPRPLPAEVSARLQERLLGEPAPEPGRIRALVWVGTRARVGAGVAAACLLVAAVTAIALTDHHPSRPAATKSPGVSASASSTSGARSSNDAVGGGVSASGLAPAGAGGQAVPQAANSAAASGATALGSSTGSGSSTASGGSASSGFAPTATPASPSTTVRSLAPQVSAVAPATGPPSGGTTVTIRGLNLEGVTAVHFGTMAALNFVVMANGQITAITPPHLPAIVNVTVTTGHGTSAISKTDQFAYSA